MKITLAITLGLAALAYMGAVRHPANPVTIQGVSLPSTTQSEWPAPVCPPDCH